MVTIISFVVTGEPVPCSRPRVTLRGGYARAFMPAKTRAYETAVGLVAASALPPGWRSDWASYRLDIQVHRGERRGDADNYAKSVLDALQPGVIANDSAVTELHVRLLDDLKQPRLLVRIERLGELDVAASRKARTRSLASARRGDR